MTNVWDEEIDLLVVGFGAAGAAAALTAARLGSRTLLIEKQDEARHTSNTRMSAGMIMTTNDADAATRYMMHCAGGMLPEAPVRQLAIRASKLLGWLNELDGSLGLVRVNGAEHKFPGAQGIDAYQVGNPTRRLDPMVASGKVLHESLLSCVTGSGAEIRYGCAAQQLLRDAEGRVIGAAVSKEGKVSRIKATKGVILTCGGFEYDEQAKLNYLRAHPIHFYGNPGNTGDGVRMAQEVGADLWHMNQMVGRAIGHHTLADGTSIGFFTTINPPGYVITDRFGQRFSNEEAQARMLHSFYFDLLQFDPAKGIYPRIPCYWFFDETRRKAGPLAFNLIGAGGVGLYTWSADNSKEIEAGWLSVGATVEEAAIAAGMDDPAAAARSVAAYNEACETGAADPQGRSTESMVAISEGPFYCVKLWPGGSNTTGGPRRDENARVLNPRGEPIPGLYAAGELGQISGLIYPADGFNLCECLCCGQIAAESALGVL